MVLSSENSFSMNSIIIIIIIVVVVTKRSSVPSLFLSSFHPSSRPVCPKLDPWRTGYLPCTPLPPITGVSDSVGPDQSPRICISHTFTEDGGPAPPRP